METYDSPPISAWSFSRLEVFEKCAYQAWLKYVQKRPEGSNEKRDKALEKGRRVHDEAEQYIRGELESMPAELKKFEDDFRKFQALYAEHPELVVMEEDWAFTTDWLPTGWFDDNAWLRLKVDRLHWLDDEQTAARLTDYKTGRKEGNEVKHGQQGQLYAIACFMQFPKLEALEVEFEYLDHGKKSLRKTYTREQAVERFLPMFTKRGLALTEATEFRPRPNRINCAWCPYGPNKGDGSCEHGVEV